eukprot:2789568-Pleurochrysis_carterae.AAC.1
MFSKLERKRATERGRKRVQKRRLKNELGWRLAKRATTSAVQTRASALDCVGAAEFTKGFAPRCSVADLEVEAPLRKHHAPAVITTPAVGYVASRH